MLHEQLSRTKSDAFVMNTQLQQAKEHSAKLAEALDALRTESGNSLVELRTALVRADQELERVKQLNSSGRTKKSLVDMKANEPGKFGGKDA